MMSVVFGVLFAISAIGGIALQFALSPALSLAGLILLVIAVLCMIGSELSYKLGAILRILQSRDK